MRTLVSACAVGVILLASCGPEAPTSGPMGPQPSPTYARPTADLDLTDRYIVVLNDDVPGPDAIADEVERVHGANVHFRYRHALKGFAATLPAQAVEALSHNPNIDYIEPDGIATKVVGGSQANPPSWGLDRIDQRPKALDGVFAYPSNGADVTVYIIDTGIRMDHTEYVGRASSGWDFVDNDNNASDCDGHGTHVAGTVGGTNVGVAKAVSLVGVRVLDCTGSGTWSGVIAGVDWVTANHVSPAVANMSLGGGYLQSVNQAVASSVASGVTYAVAAGNNNRAACSYSPASEPSAITVGASDVNDVRASFSNYGSCVDIFAPGVGITSSTMTSTTSRESWSGTSMASPHVAGVAALYLADNRTATPSQVASALINNATLNALSSIGTGSPNRLLYDFFTPAAATAVHVDAMTGAAVSMKGGWKANVTITVKNTTAVQSGVTVTATWSGGSASAVTNASGQCTISTGKFKSSVGSVKVSVSDLSGTGFSYDSGANVVSSVTVNKP